MNNFKTKIIDFNNYLKQSYKPMIVIIIFFFIIGLNQIISTTIIKNISDVLILLIPIFLSILIENIKFNRLTKKNKIQILKEYIIKYLKIYSIFLIILVISSLLVLISYTMLSYIMLINKTSNRGVGYLTIVLIAAFIGIEGVSFFITIFPTIVFNIKNNAGIFKSIIFGKIFMKTQFFKHIYFILSIAFIYSPLLIVSKLINIEILNILFQCIYITIIIECIIYDVDKKTETILNIMIKKDKNKSRRK